MSTETLQDDDIIYRWSRWRLLEHMAIGLVMFLIFGYLSVVLWRMPLPFDIWSIVFAIVAFPFCWALTAMGVYAFMDALLLLISRNPALIVDRDGFAYFCSMSLLRPFQFMGYVRLPFLRVWSIEKLDFEFRGQGHPILNVSYQLQGMVRSKTLIVHSKLIKAEPGEIETRLKQMWQARKQEEPIDWTTQRW